MDLPTLIILLAFTAVLLILEQKRVPLTLSLDFKGDIKRESRWFAQYGQTSCTVTAALLVWSMDPRPQLKPVMVISCVAAAGIASGLLKRLLGRVRPGRPAAGAFLGPKWRHASWRESFPSSHSACAVALSAVLVELYPGGWEVFWPLAIICATLRYLLDAHWPSDVVGGAALGYAVAWSVMSLSL